jgi:hypothetical protein
MIIKTIRAGIYNRRITTLFYQDPKEIEQKFRKYDFSSEFKDTDGSCFVVDGRIYIAFDISSGKQPTPGVIAHEAKHAVNEIFKSVGYELDVRNDEAECYFLGWLVDEICKQINSINKIA